MTEYETSMFLKLDTLETLDKWYGIKQDRPDLVEFITTLKKRINLQDDFIFSNCYTKFKRVLPFKSKINSINIQYNFMPDIFLIHDKEKEKLKEQFPKEPWKKY